MINILFFKAINSFQFLFFHNCLILEACINHLALSFLEQKYACFKRKYLSSGFLNIFLHMHVRKCNVYSTALVLQRRETDKDNI